MPLNKRIWTPSYVVLGTGLSCLVLAAFLWWCGRRLGNDGLGPLQTLGANAIAVYVATSLAATTVLAPVQEPVVRLAGRAGAAGRRRLGRGMLLAGYAVPVLQRAGSSSGSSRAAAERAPRPFDPAS